jgi:thioredoxin reductase
MHASGSLTTPLQAPQQPGNLSADVEHTSTTAPSNGKTPHERVKPVIFVADPDLPGVFAAGDVRHNSVKRVASAVGEGAMAIVSIHEYLAENAA